ncbi:MAG: GAF domain-containing protein, partial [Ignavibacteriales bacterium]
MADKTNKYEKRIQQLEGELSGFKSAVAELKILNEIAVAAGKEVSIDQTLKLILNKTVNAVNAEHGAILLVSENQEVFKTFIKQENESKIRKSPHIGEHITGWVLLNNKSLIVKDLSKDQRFKTSEDEKEIIKSLICSPIWYEGRIIGVLQMINKRSDKGWHLSFTDNDLTLLSIISVQAGQLIKNSELQLISYEKKKEAEVARLETEKLQELDRIKTNFFTNLSHEFRTPLTLILGPLEKLMDQKNYSEEQIILIYKNANKLLKLINQLLDLSSLDAGKMKLDLEKEDIVRFIKVMASSFQPLAEIKNINLTFSSSVEALPVLFDKDKIEKILNNLLINAIKFTNNGQIIISVSNEFQFINNNKYFELIVEDTGSGIPSEKIKNIFERFFTDNNEIAQPGTGIGLALAKELIELHHGFISVESELNKGTRFKVLLPLEDEYYKNLGMEIPGEEKVIKKTNAESLKPKTVQEVDQEEPSLVLIVEDNDDIRKFIKESIDQTMRIIESPDGKDGLEKAFINIPDLVISDVLMPEMNGI